MEKRKKDLCLLFAAVLLLIFGTVGIVFATGESTMEVTSISVTASSGSTGAAEALKVFTDENITTAGIDTNAYIDSDIFIKFSQNVADDEATKSKINLQKINKQGVPNTERLISNNEIFISNKNITIEPTVGLSADTYYLVTVSPGVAIHESADVSTTTYQAIYKTGTQSQQAPASTTFSAIMTSPVSAGNVITNAVDRSSAVFSFTFSELIKNKDLISPGAVTITKVSGGSQTVASDGAIVATTESGGLITAPKINDPGIKNITLTVASAALEPSTTYQLKLGRTFTSTPTGKILGEGIAYTFTTAEDSVEPSVPLQPIYLYPSNGAKDVGVDANLVIGFSEAIKATNSITNGKSVELVDSSTGTTLASEFTLSDDRTTITVNPTSDLSYGRDYTFRIVSGKITKEDGSSPLPASEITFGTTSFSQVTASALTTGADGKALTISTSLFNSKTSEQKVKIAYVVRRDKGARLEDGGTVVITKTTTAACTANGVTDIPINVPDISVDQYGNPLSKAVYVDIYILNNSNAALYHPIHIRAE